MKINSLDWYNSFIGTLIILGCLFGRILIPELNIIPSFIYILLFVLGAFIIIVGVENLNFESDILIKGIPAAMLIIISLILLAFSNSLLIIIISVILFALGLVLFISSYFNILNPILGGLIHRPSYNVK